MKEYCMMGKDIGIVVNANNAQEAMEKAESFDGDYFVHKNEITNTELIEVLDK